MLRQGAGKSVRRLIGKSEQWSLEIGGELTIGLWQWSLVGVRGHAYLFLICA